MSDLRKVPEDRDLVDEARRVFESQIGALQEVQSKLDASFARAVALIMKSSGKVVVAGVGKSGLIGRKIAATLSSTGTPAVFLHAGEAVHGDLGVYAVGDVTIVITKSGSTSEIVLVPYDEAYETGFEDMRRRVPDISKIKRVIDWEPTTPLDETIDQIVAYQKVWLKNHK